MKNLTLFNLLTFCFLILSSSCSKNDSPNEDEDLNDGTVSLLSMTSISCSNLKSESIWVDIDSYERVFPTPVTSLKLDNIFEDVKDSVAIDLDLPDYMKIETKVTVPTVLLPGSHEVLVTDKDSLKVSAFPFEVGFRSSLRYDITESYDGLISKIIIDRSYERKRFTADVAVTFIDANNSSHVVHGTLSGSKLGQTKKDVYVW
ncbi:hypothetical protein [Sphingobacterium hungaricum]